MIEKKPGRPREFDEGEILAKIMDLFWANGYFGTSLAMIEQATEIKKQSLYTAFGDKHGMYLAALINYEKTIVRGAIDGLRSANPPIQRIHEFLSAPIMATFDHDDKRGCFLCNASADRAALDSDTQRLVARGFKKLETALANALAEAGGASKPTDHLEEARLLLAVYSGLRVMARSGLDRKQLECARDLAISLSQTHETQPI